ncbi:MAG: zinc ribbon domain-containing protein [Methanobrevibacter sp.]
MICPNCNSENNEGAKFCKKCGTPLAAKTMDHGTLINSIEKDKSDNTTKIIIIALVIVAIVLAGAFIYLQGFGSDHSKASSDAVNLTTQQQSAPATATPQSSVSSMKIISGSFSTGSAESAKTYASIYVGTQYSGQSVIVQIWYSRDGSTLNNGNMVPVTVHSDGYIQVSSADAYHYYPDKAKINLYDSSSKLLDSKTVYLSPTSGTQTF